MLLFLPFALLESFPFSPHASSSTFYTSFSTKRKPCLHPPPVFFLMEFIFKFFDMEIALIVFDAIRCYPFLKSARRARRKVQLYPHTGLRIFPDCAVIFPARCSVCTALILRNEYVCLFEGAFRNLIYGRSHLTPQNFQEICACFLCT